ncbi:MAG: hypothetical protein ACLKAK_10950, partial [Alkaliphilus sp.]
SIYVDEGDFKGTIFAGEPALETTLNFALLSEENGLRHWEIRHSIDVGLSGENFLDFFNANFIAYATNHADSVPNFETHRILNAYRVDTYVITAVRIFADEDITPDNTAVITMNANGYTKSTEVVIPKNEFQLVWLKWRTPNTPQDVEINVEVTGNGAATIDGVNRSETITSRVVELSFNTPPDPTANDRNDSFLLPVVPVKASRNNSSWRVFSADWIAGSWVFTYTDYTATLSANMNLVPGNKTPAQASVGDTMKSGYGVNILILSDAITNAAGSDITAAQNAFSFFPEFNYQNYGRVLETTHYGNFEFRENRYSTFNSRAHFTPLWFPDGRYTVLTKLIDVWTPGGMLRTNLHDHVNIEGNLFEDWHIGPKGVNN